MASCIWDGWVDLVGGWVGPHTCGVADILTANNTQPKTVICRPRICNAAYGVAADLYIFCYCSNGCMCLKEKEGVPDSGSSVL